MSMQVIRSHTPSEQAGKALEVLLQKNASRPIALFLSAGSALALLEYISPDGIGSQVTVSLIDERCSTNPQVNNYAQLLRTTFMQNAIARGAQVMVPEIIDEDSCRESAVQFENALHEWKTKYPNGVVIATLGVGSDGHTAGIMPGEYGVDFSGDDLVVSYTVPRAVNQHTKRITTTYTFLTTYVDHAVVFAAGEEKRRIVATLEAGECDIQSMPACIFTKMSDATLYTDI